MLTKEQIIEAINSLPEEKFGNVEAIIEEIILLEKIDKGLQAVKNGEVTSEEDADREMEQW